ncbi:antitoxin Xre/MbcA/ParS toxin-binding domain-containing protein [Deinococcus sp. UYEF24]
MNTQDLQANLPRSVEVPLNARHLADVMGLSVRELAKIVNRHPSSLYRRPSGNDALQKRLRPIAELVALVTVLESAEYLRNWLRAPLPILIGRRPIEVMREDGGSEELIDTIHAVLSGQSGF